MIGETTLARRYARALLQATIDTGEVARVEQDLHGLADSYEASPELRTYLGSPSFGREDKKRLLEGMLEGRVSPLTQRFARLLIEKGRFKHIRAIADAFDEANDAVMDVAKVSVTTFLPLSEAQRAKLIERLQRFTSRSTIRLDEKVDAGLLGGMVVRLGDTVLDGSVKGRLQRLRQHLWLEEHEKTTRAAALAAETLAQAEA